MPEKPEKPNPEKPNPDAIREEIESVTLETAKLNLEEARERNARLKAEKAERSRKNRQRQAQLANDRETARRVQADCFHQQGGGPEDTLEGDGPSILTVAIMPDGYSELLQCARCGLALMTPHPLLKKEDPKKFAADKKYFDALRKKAKGNKLQPMQCVSFTFQKDDGTPIIPEWGMLLRENPGAAV